jgi:predicted MFS family arabinose efflux permease
MGWCGCAVGAWLAGKLADRMVASGYIVLAAVLILVGAIEQHTSRDRPCPPSR